MNSNIRMMRHLKIVMVKILLWFCLPYTVVAQSEQSIKRNGYLINFGVYGWFFQPCENPKSLYDALNSSNFSIRYGTDGYNDALWSFEHTHTGEMNIDTVFYEYGQKNGNFVGEIKYLYVQMRYSREIHNNLTQNIPLCLIKLHTPSEKKKTYKLGCIWSGITIHEIELLGK